VKKILFPSLLAAAIAVAVVGCGKSHTDSVLEPAPVLLCQPGGGLDPGMVSVPPEDVEAYLAQGYQVAPCAGVPTDDGGGNGDPGVDPGGDDDDDGGGVGTPAGDDDDDDDDDTTSP